MDKKAKLLDAVSAALKDGTISRGDLQKLMSRHGTKLIKEDQPGRLSAVDVMFYVASIVLFAAIVALVNQVWDEGLAVRAFLSAGVGALFWAAALYFLIRPRTSDIERGMTNALLLTGSLSIIFGGFVIAHGYTPHSSDLSFYAISIALVVLGLVHMAFGWQIKRALLLLTGVLLFTASFPSFAFGILGETDTPFFIYCLVVATSGGLLAYITRIVARYGVGTEQGRIFDPLAVFTILMSLYVASYDDSGLVWLLVLVMGIIGLFYLSIITQNKLLLGNGSFFLVLAIITISFRYFSGNAAISLLISAAGLLGTAVMAAHINRRYIK